MNRGDVYKSERGYEITDFEWALGWPIYFNTKEIAQNASEIMQKNTDEIINHETALLRQRIAELANACEKALAALPDADAAAAYLREVIEAKADNPIWQYGQEIRLYRRGEDYELIVHYFGDDDDMHMLSSLDEAFEILSLHHGYTEMVLRDFPKA